MIGNDVLKAVLAESKAEFVQASIWTLSDRDNSFVRRWQIDRSQAQEAEEFLRKYLSAANHPNDGRTITNPVATTVREGVYRGGRVMAKLEIDPQSKTEEWFIYQELRKGLANTTLLGGSVDFSAWRVQNAESFRSDSNTVVLELPNVDPSAEQAILGELTADTFSSLSTINESLSGTWHNIKATAKMEDDGSYSILLFLSKHNNSDLYFKFQAGPDTIKGFYYKWEATETTLAELIVTKQFDADGDIVTSTGKTLQDVVSGRTVQMRRTVRDPEDRLFDVEIEIAWTAAYSLAVASSSIVFQKFEGASVAIDQGFGIPDSLLPNYAANYNAAALAENQLGNFQFERDQENGTFRFTGSITTLTARQGYIDCGDKWVFFGGQTASTSLIDVPSAINGGVALTFSAFRTTALAGFKSEGSVSASTETGLFAYNIQVQKNGVASSYTAAHSASNIEQRWIENGRGPVLPVDILSSYDDVYGLWYEVVDFKFDGVAGNYTWQKTTTRYCAPSAGSWVDFSPTVAPEKKDVVFNRSFQPSKYRNRGNWKEEAVPWHESWNGYEGSTEAPETWISLGYQAMYGNWQSWFDKAFIYAPTGPDVPVWASSYDAWSNTKNNYAVNDLVNYNGHFWKALHVAATENKAKEPWSGSANINTDYWQFTGTGVSRGSNWNSGITYAVGNQTDYFVGGSPAFRYYTSILGTHAAITGITPGTSAWHWEDQGVDTSGDAQYATDVQDYTLALQSLRMQSGDDFGCFIGRAGTSYCRYTPDRFGQKSLHWNYKVNDYGDVGAAAGPYATNQTRDLDYLYETPAYGYSIYSLEVVLLKKYRVRREYIRWCDGFENYGGTETPPDWTAGGFAARYGDWNANYVKAESTAGDDAGPLVGINSSISVNRYQPTPQNIGLNWSVALNQAGDVGAAAGLHTTNQTRDLDYNFAVAAYGFSVYDHPLVEAVVLASSGEPEIDMDTGIQYSAVPYENPAFCVLGQRLVRYAKSQVSRYYLTVNPAFLATNPIPTMAAVLADSNSNRNVSYKPVKISEYLWAIEKTVTEFTEWKADLHEVDADGNVRNWPKVDQAGFYFLRHFPMEGNSFTGEDVTTGKVAYPPTIFD
jgi:hypothetical protein